LLILSLQVLPRKKILMMPFCFTDESSRCASSAAPHCRPPRAAATQARPPSERTCLASCRACPLDRQRACRPPTHLVEASRARIASHCGGRTRPIAEIAAAEKSDESYVGRVLG
jgi:hypothetical protein